MTKQLPPRFGVGRRYSVGLVGPVRIADRGTPLRWPALIPAQLTGHLANSVCDVTDASVLSNVP